MTGSFLRQTLRAETVKMRLEAATKADAIAELVGILAATGQLRDPAEALRVVLARERMMSTGMEQGIAIPHGKSDTVDGLLVGLALKPEGMDFECQDGQPARILIVTLSPASRTGPHLRFMADITRLLRDEGLRRAVLAAGSPAEVVALLTGR
ncbi:MAG: PTS sugar transporter subunit IIA [Lentisphaeria bacterium]|nr:PTS sugar transporter subunit IIA [Lentisphaeria bacterium]